MSDKKGWIISLSVDAYQLKENTRENYPYLSWSPYDRVEIKEVRKFSEFFEGDVMPDWTGTIQRLHLIPIQNFDWEIGDRCLIKCINENKGTPFGLYCIFTARFQNRMEDPVLVRQEICDRLQEKLNEKEVGWACFESLGAEEFVGIFLADQISVLAETVHIVKSMKFEMDEKQVDLFGSVCSFLGLNDTQFGDDQLAGLMVRLNLKSANDSDKAIKMLKSKFEENTGQALKDEDIKGLFLGKYALEVRLDNVPKALECFKEDGVFNGRSEYYQQYVESSRSFWYVSNEPKTALEPIVFSANGIEMLDVKDKVELKTEVQQPIVKFILKEFRRLMVSKGCFDWIEILWKQYNIYKECVLEYIETDAQENLCSINNKVQTMLLHISQATAYLQEIPLHNYYYAGSYNDVLRMYYGIITAFLSLGYNMPHDAKTRQHDITFCVDFESAVKVHSSIYKMKSKEERFVVFHLPYRAFIDFSKTIKLLGHEVFHYIAPRSRMRRNFVYLKVWAIDIFEQCMKILSENKLTTKQRDGLFEQFDNEYGDLMDEIEQKLLKDECYEEYSNMIINDFSDFQKYRTLRRVAEHIIVILTKWIEKREGEFIERLKEENESFDWMKLLFENQEWNYMKESIRRLSKAEKEAFCDLNMVGILELSIGEYIELIWSTFFGGTQEEKMEEMLQNFILGQSNIDIASFDLRVGMVFDVLLQDEVKDDSTVEQRLLALESMLKRDDFKEKNIPGTLYDYLKKTYGVYLRGSVRRGRAYRELFDYIREYWKKEITDGAEELRSLLRQAIRTGDGIWENVKVIREFSRRSYSVGTIKPDAKTDEPFFEKGYAIRHIGNENKIFVKSLGEYVTKVCLLVKNWGKNNCWYRGVCDDTFPLTPSLFRNCDPELSLYANQAKYLKDAYYETISMPSLWTEQLKGIAEHTCCLQHYGMPTSLLDFSLDMLISLHFALNPDLPKDKERVENRECQPEIVLFNPLIYSEAIQSLSAGRLIEKPKNISPVLFDVTHEDLSQYFVSDMSAETLMKHSEKYTEKYVPNPRTDKYPRPVIIRQSNERILAQSGTFLAFDLNAGPAEEKKGEKGKKEKKEKKEKTPYDYLDIRMIQSNYNKLLEASGKPIRKGQFLKFIYIDKLQIKTIKKELVDMGITAPKVYPELFRVFQSYRDRLLGK